MPLDQLDAAVDLILERCGKHLIAAAPLGLGKPHRLLNAIYRRVAADPSLSLHLSTALSLTPPKPGSELEKRFLGPFLERHFGPDFEPLDHVAAQKSGSLPPNIQVEEFYLQSGLLLNAPEAQRHYASINYTHVARAMAGRGVNLLVQMVSREPGGTRLSLACNPDVTFDVIDRLRALGLPRPFLIAEVHPDLPFHGGDAAVGAEFFDAVLEIPGPAPQLFALPRQPVSEAEFAIGLHASTLVRDGGTLQIGIGALSDALSHALVLRQTRNPEYRQLIDSLEPELFASELHCQWGGMGQFEAGLYGASEMITDGFMHLVEAGVIKRRVVDDIELMQRVFDGEESDEDRARIEAEGRVLHAAFYVGSKDFYRWLRELPPERQRAIGMTRVSHINELYGGREALERLQRRDARFFNTCMMMTLFGAAVSDALDDGRVVSGVGGQYNFVAMAHALDEGRSVLMFRASRDNGGGPASNIVFDYGHVTIPRHLRDIAVTEYGIADLRDKSDEDCIKALLAICDARFIDGLVAQAKAAGKLAADFEVPRAWRGNTPERLTARLKPYRQMGLLPDYPLGSDFTEVEQRLVRALQWLRASTGSRGAKLRTLLTALRTPLGGDREALARMDLASPAGLKQVLLARLVSLGLGRTA
jgi:acyl-CoA hydrolase